LWLAGGQPIQPARRARNTKIIGYNDGRTDRLLGKTRRLKPIAAMMKPIERMLQVLLSARAVCGIQAMSMNVFAGIVGVLARRTINASVVALTPPLRSRGQ